MIRNNLYLNEIKFLRNIIEKQQEDLKKTRKIYNEMVEREEKIIEWSKKINERINELSMAISVIEYVLCKSGMIAKNELEILKNEMKKMINKNL